MSRSRLETIAFQAARRTLRAIRGIPAVRRMYYRALNQESFGNLYAHDSMLADRVRMDAYARAIARHIRPGTVVIDVGTGSGVLACLAAKRGARVHAIEHSPMIEHARTLARANGLGDRITFHAVHSRDFVAPEPVDVILHEQIGLNLIDEDMVENLGLLRERCLAPGGFVLPARFRLYADPVQLHDGLTLPYHWEHRVHGLDFSCFRPEVPPWVSGDGGDKRMLEPDDVARSLAREQSLMSLDLDTLGRGALPGRLGYETTLAEGGRLDGFALYFQIAFDDEIEFKTGPGHPRTHWSARLLRTEARPVSAGQRLRFALDASNVTRAQHWTWSYELSASAA